MTMKKPRIAIVKSLYRPDIVDQLAAGAIAVLAEAGVEYEVFEVGGSLEIPAAVEMLCEDGKGWEGFVVLGCVLKGDTIHDQVIAYTVFPALDEIARRRLLPLGNGVLTVNDLQQAEERANPARQNRGGEAARAMLHMYKIRYGVKV